MQKSQSIEVLRLPLAILIIYIHFGGAFDTSLQEYGIQWFLHTNANEWFRMIVKCFSNLAVPVFFFISGYLFFGGSGFSKKIYAKKLKSRLYTLLIPYILWNIIRFVVEIPREGIDSWPLMFIAPANGQFWFIRDLIYLSILSLLLYYFIKRIGFIFPLFFYVIDALELLTYDIHDGYLMIGSVSYFSFGACFSIKSKNIDDVFQKCFKISFVALAIYIVFSFMFAFTATNRFLSSALLLAAFPGLFNLTITFSPKVQSFLAKYACTSFFIYATHRIVGMGFQALFKIAGLRDLFWNEYFFLVRILLISGVCVVIYYLLKRFSLAIVFKSLAGSR